MREQKRQHIYYKCSCQKSYCQFCDGGLAFCIVCKCGEGSLASECPGLNVQEDDQDKICKDILDFVNNRWIVK